MKHRRNFRTLLLGLAALAVPLALHLGVTAPADGDRALHLAAAVTADGPAAPVATQDDLGWG